MILIILTMMIFVIHNTYPPLHLLKKMKLYYSIQSIITSFKKIKPSNIIKHIKRYSISLISAAIVVMSSWEKLVFLLLLAILSTFSLRSSCWWTLFCVGKKGKIKNKQVGLHYYRFIKFRNCLFCSRKFVAIFKVR